MTTRQNRRRTVADPAPNQPSPLLSDEEARSASRRRGSAEDGMGAGTAWTRLVDAWRKMNDKPLVDYLMLRVFIFLLVGVGVIMVMSSSMTWSIRESENVWGTALRQIALVGVGLVAFWAALRIRPRTVRRASFILLLIAIGLLIAVLIPGIGTGREEVGSQSWIILGPLRLQPSEVAKVALGIWGAAHLADRRPPGDLRQEGGAIKPWGAFLLVALLVVGLVVLEHDVGMALNIALMVIILLFFAGIPKIYVALLGGFGFLVVLIEALGGGFRSHRITVYLDALFGNFHDTRNTAFQSYQGFLSLADGSIGGVGLGQSRAKWFYLPEAKNDFIFAVIGEELGLWGGAMVILFFLFLGIYGFRTALRAQDQFQSLMAATLTAGVVSQAFINIGYVVGLLPVTGIQLPMISAGGTSAIITLGSMGLLANVARHEPEAVSAMQSYGRPAFDRTLAIPEPTVPAPRPRDRRERRQLSRSRWRDQGEQRWQDRTGTDLHSDLRARQRTTTWTTSTGRGGSVRRDSRPHRPRPQRRY